MLIVLVALIHTEDLDLRRMMIGSQNDYMPPYVGKTFHREGSRCHLDNGKVVDSQQRGNAFHPYDVQNKESDEGGRIDNKRPCCALPERLWSCTEAVPAKGSKACLCCLQDIFWDTCQSSEVELRMWEEYSCVTSAKGA